MQRLPVLLEPWHATRVLAGAGVLGPGSLVALARSGLRLARAGLTPAGAYAFGAARFPTRSALIDDRGSCTFSDMWERSESLACAFADYGMGPQDRVGVLCRNHHLFVEAVTALSRLGSDIVLLNTSFARPQVRSALRHHHIRHLVLDAEFVPRIPSQGVTRFLAWSDGPRATIPSLGTLDQATPRPLPWSPSPASRYVLLTSGTTGEPRSVARPVPLSLEPVVSVLSRVPMRVADVVLIATPLSHALGFGHLGLSLVLSSTVVLQRAFDPESTLAAVHRHHVRVLVVVPFMIERLAELPDAVRDRYDLSSLDVVVSSSAPLRGELAERFMNCHGDILYNVYGSTEAAWATIARPEDLRAAPGTAGRPTPGTRVRVLDPTGADAPAGVTGAITVEGRLTVGTDGPQQGRCAGTGDLGHFDSQRRLFVDGREDDMVVSGGENVYPQPVEDALMAHPAIDDAAVVAVPDPEWGQRLQAFVTVRKGQRLTADEVRRYLSDRLPRYAVPREVVFVDALPHSELGKTLHGQLRRR